MDRRAIIVALAALVLSSTVVPFYSGLGSSSTNKAEALVSKPNIVVILVDDLDERSLDIMLSKGLMPKLKQQIIDKGVTFSKAFDTFPLCCPSRSTFLTGEYPHNHGVWSNELPDGGVSKFNDKSTLATWLQDAGYFTGYIGKYLNMYGIDTAETYVPPGWDDWQATVGESTYLMYSYTINDNGKLVKYGSAVNDYQTDVIANRSVQFVSERESADSTPFFLFINPLAPHVEDSTPECKLNYGSLGSTLPPQRYIGTTSGIKFPTSKSFNEADVSDKPAKLRFSLLTAAQTDCLDELFHARLETMRAVDDLIGRLVNALSSKDELSRTVIVFASDNGFLLGEHRMHGKTRAYEESIGIPLYIRIPGVAPMTINRLVTNNDFAPTFLELARGTAGIPIDGRSLIPLIGNPAMTWRNGFLVETPRYAAIRADDYVYVYHFTGGKEVYDLITDPDQMQNVKSVSPWSGKITALDSWRLDLMSCKDTSCRTTENRQAP